MIVAVLIAAVVAGIGIGLWTQTGKGASRPPVTHHLKRFAGYCAPPGVRRPEIDQSVLTASSGRLPITRGRGLSEESPRSYPAAG
jgi:hypothetical protein